MGFIPKNYNTDGGDTTVIGGKLSIVEGAEFTGFPVLANQGNSSATTVAGLKEDFNTLITNLKNIGYMVRDTWNISVAKIAQVPADANTEVCTANQAAVSAVTIADSVITIAADRENLAEYPSTNPAQGTHEWVGINITTGLSDITAIKYNGSQLTQADAAETASVGGSAGDIVMWLKIDEIAATPKKFTLWAPGYELTEFTVALAE